MINAALFSSQTDKWNSPPDLIKHLKREFHFDLDVCASSNNVCETYYDEEINGLAQEWNGLCWCNPPYCRKIGDWMAKAKQSAIENDATVTCLVPARTDTRWWHDNVDVATLVLLIKGRLKFGGAKNSAPFPSAIIAFGQVSIAQESLLRELGLVYKTACLSSGFVIYYIIQEI